MRIKVGKGLGLAALILGGWALGRGVGAEDSNIRAMASITRFTGEVRIQQQGRWLPAYRTVFLFSGDQVMTGKGRAEVQFTDGSLLTLTQFCTVTVREEAQNNSWLGLFQREFQQRTVALARGKLWFDVRPETEVETALETPTMVCGILGTAGELGHDATLGSMAGLSRGLARVTSKATGLSVRLRANQRTRVTGEGPPEPPESYTPPPAPLVELPVDAIPDQPEPLFTGRGPGEKFRPGAGQGEFQVNLPAPPAGGDSGSGSVSP